MATFAPVFALEVAGPGGGEGVDIGEDIQRFVKQVEYETVDGMADMGKINLVNPDSYVSDAKIFQPGNEVSFFGGYSKSELTHLGRIKIVRQVPNYPEQGEPTLMVTGYTKDSTDMMDNEPKPKKKGETPKPSDNRRYANAIYSDAIEAVAERYNFKTDIDPTESAEKDIIQKVGVKDYDFVRGLANITGYYFWVDGDEKGDWTIHFKHPGATEIELGQEKIYTFTYNFGDESSLLSFTPELLIKGAKTNLAVTVKDRMTGRVMFVEVDEESDASPDLDATGDLTGVVDGEYTTASDIKLFINDFSFDVVSNRRFKVEADVIDWAQQWFRRMRENFILSRGTTIGLETLASRQHHNIEGVSAAYSGSYFFSKVKHIFGDNSGYKCMFGARKVVP